MVVNSELWRLIVANYPFHVVKTINHPPNHHKLSWYKPSNMGWFMIVLATLVIKH